jgi:hypothetical protein
MWCINKTTDIVVTDEGVKYGRVLGGSEIGFKLIAENLGISWGAVQSNMAYLVKAGLIYRTRSSAMQEYRYFVIDCQKKFKDKPKPVELPQGTTVAGQHKGKTIYHTPFELYPAGTTCSTCSNTPEECVCWNSCSQEGCSYAACGMKDDLLHLYSVHRLKLALVDGAWELQSITENKQFSTPEINDEELDFLDDGKTTSFNIEGDDDELE